MFNALLGISTLLSDSIQKGWDGFYGNLSDNYLCSTLQKIRERFPPTSDPRNHVLQRALRKSYLESVLLLCGDRLRELNPQGWKRLLSEHLKPDAANTGGLWLSKLWNKLAPAGEDENYEYKWLQAVMLTLNNERNNIDKTSSPMEISGEFELFLQPKGTATVEQRVKEMRDHLQKSLIDELQNTGSQNIDGLPHILSDESKKIPPRILEMIEDGWIPYHPSEDKLPLNDKTRNWFDCFSAFFQQKLTGEVADILHTRFLNRLIVGEGLASNLQPSQTHELTIEQFNRELKNTGGEITGQINLVESQIGELKIVQAETAAKIGELLPLLVTTADIAEIVKNLPGLIKREHQQTRDEIREEIRETANRLVEELKTPAAEHKLPSNIPKSQGFVGRETYLKQLREWYAAEKRCFILHGMGGAGKTELARRFVEEIEVGYDAHLSIDLRGAGGSAMTSAEAMWQIVNAFYPQLQRPQIPLADPQTGEPLTIDEQSALEIQALQSYYIPLFKEHKILLLLDNAKDEAQIEPLNKLNGGCLIVTARHNIYLSGCEELDIEEMSPENAAELLERKLGKDRFKGQTNVIANLCGYLPLALRAAEGVLFNKAFLSAETYAKKLEQSRLQLKNSERNATVETIFALSYDYLEPHLQKYWRQLSVFPSDFDITAAAAVWSVEAGQAEEITADLISYSLLKWNKETNRFKLHDLMRDFTAAKLSGDERFQTKYLHAKHYTSILIRANEMQTNNEPNHYLNALKMIDTDWNNIITGQRWTAKHTNHDNNAITELCIEYCGYARDFVTLRLHFRDDINWLESGLSAARKLNNRWGEGISLGNLGNAYYSLGEYRKAIDYHEQFLAISREIGDRSGEGISLGNLGNAYDSLGEYRKAIDYHEQSLAISKEIGDRSGEGTSLGNLGNAYYRLGEYRKAIDYHEQSLAISREIGDRSGEGISLGNLGNAYDSLGEYRKAIDYHEQSLAISREIGDRSGEGISLGNLGHAYKNLGEYRKAIDYHEQFLAISREIGDRSGEGISLGNLGNAYDSLGEYRKAIDYHEQFLAISREIGDRSGEGISLGNLGNVYKKLGEIEKACGLWKEALSIFEIIESPFANNVRQWIADNCGE